MGHPRARRVVATLALVAGMAMPIGGSGAAAAAPNVPRMLSAVSCGGPASCFTVGFTGVSGHPDQDKTFTEHWNGTKWTAVGSPNPAGSLHARLAAVSCASPTYCLALGSSWGKDSRKAVSLVEVWNGKAWSIAAKTDVATSDVACPKPKLCFSVHSRTVERWNGTSWSIVQRPKDLNPAARLAGISCASATSCAVVGSIFVSSLTTEKSFAERWNGKTWKVSPTPKTISGQNFELSRVSCTSATSCSASGEIGGGLASFSPLTERWDGKRWSVVPSPAAGDGQLPSVSCATSSKCFAVGLFDESGSFGNRPQLLASRWNGSAFASVPVPLASGWYGEFVAVACAKPTVCFAVGYQRQLIDGESGYLGPSSPLVERWNGSTWAIVANA